MNLRTTIPALLASALLAPVLLASARADEPAAGPGAMPLPLRQVVLFSSGVGYFQRVGRVNGGATVDLAFRAEQVNDILKSLVLFDPSGSVRPVTYATRDAITRRLQTV